jgi:hypothetical protein
VAGSVVTSGPLAIKKLNVGAPPAEPVVTRTGR